MSTTKLVCSPTLPLPCLFDPPPTQLQEWEQSWTEPLHEYSQFADIIRKLLTYRHQKHVQYEMTKYALESKREQLEDIERSEAEAQRLQSALSGATQPSGTIRRTGGRSVLSGEIDEDDGSGSAPTVPAPSVYSSQPLQPRRKQSGVGLLGALSYSLHGLMDVDPETARRNQLSKTKESISQVRSFWRSYLVLGAADGRRVVGRCATSLCAGLEVRVIDDPGRLGSVSEAKSRRYAGDVHYHGQDPPRVV